jgi:hypothetical protein
MGDAAGAATAGFDGGAGLVAPRRLTYTDKAVADHGWRAIAATPVFQARHVTLSDVRPTDRRPLGVWVAKKKSLF